jgi:acyl-CoA oxidase
MKKSEQASQPISLALAELGCETNPKQLGTVATYDPKKQVFILHTITPFLQKYWCGGIGQDSKVAYAVVWARIIANKESQGVHPFLIPVTDSSGKLYEGITAGDLGEKIGVNGLQNGSLSFKKFPVPKACLLDKFFNID